MITIDNELGVTDINNDGLNIYRGTHGITNGKYYFEFQMNRNNTNNTTIGVGISQIMTELKKIPDIFSYIYTNRGYLLNKTNKNNNQLFIYNKGDTISILLILDNKPNNENKKFTLNNKHRIEYQFNMNSKIIF